MAAPGPGATRRGNAGMPKKPCRWRKRLVPLAILCTPLLAWVAITLIVPTGWARGRIAARLAQVTGRPVRIGSIAMGWTGHLRVRDVAISEAGDPGHPWVTIPEAGIDVHLGQVLMGKCAPGEIRLTRPTIRVVRSQDGTWLCGGFPPPGRPAPAPAATDAAGPADAAASNATVLVIDEGEVEVDDRRAGVHFLAEHLAARGSIGPGVVALEEARATVNGGVAQVAARVERDGHALRFEVEARAEGVDIDAGLDGLAHLVPIVDGADGGVRGTLGLHLAARGRGRTVAEALRSLRGDGSLVLAPVDLTGSPFLAELDVLGDWPEVERVGSLSCDFTVEHRRANSTNLTLQVNRFPLVLAGWTDFDGRFDYGVRGDSMSEMISKDARVWLKEAGVHLDQLEGIRVVGGPGRVEATLKGQPLRVPAGEAQASGRGRDRDPERAQLRETARRIRDRFFR